MHIDIMETHWDQDANHYGSIIEKELASFRVKAWQDLLRNYLPAPGARILDMGCGPGFFSIILAAMGYDVVAIDCAQAMLDKAQEHVALVEAGKIEGLSLQRSIQFLHLDLAEMVSHFGPASFEAIVSRNVTWTLENPEATYTDCYSLLGEGGRLLTFDANWFLPMFDRDLAQEAEERRLQCIELYGDDLESDDTADSPLDVTQLPLSSVVRPQWDIEALQKAGFRQVEELDSLIASLWDDKERLLYGATPLFGVVAYKGRAQDRMPYVELLETYKKEGFVPFHTPGHKIGHGAPQTLIDWMGPALPYDLGVMYALDDLHEPEGAFKEAQELAADLYGADAAWYSINGTTALIMTMIMATVGEGDSIIIPREAHRSVMSGLVMSGAKPVYLPSQFNEDWGLQLGATYEDVVRTLDAHPEAKVILLVYPNYYGLGVDIEAIVAECHRRGLIVLVDEAHGPHLPFDKRLPIEAVEAGADLVASSTHKSVGSLTQTSTLFGQGDRIDYRRVTQVHQMFQSTSPNYVFMASLDMARHQLANEGERLVGQAVDLAYNLRHRLAQIPGIRVMDGQALAKNFDPTKVLIDARDLGLDATNFESRLRAHHIEVELIQAHHVLVTITIGDSQESIDALVEAVKQVSQEVLANKEKAADTLRLDDSSKAQRGPCDHDRSSLRTKLVADDHEVEAVKSKDHKAERDAMGLPKPKVVLTPRQGFFAKKERVKLSEALGRVCGETITYYPPGIPFVGIGEEITQEVLDFIAYKQATGFEPNGASDMSLDTIVVLENNL